MAIAVAVTSVTAGNGVVTNGGVAPDGGLGALFAVLMGGAESQGGDVPDTLTGGLDGAARNDFTMQTVVQFGDGPAVEVQGESDTVTAFVAQVQQIYQQVVLQGGLTLGKMGDSRQLAAALTKLGMDPEQAAGVAEGIQTMLKLLEQQQKLDDASVGSLAVLMMGVMLQQNGNIPAITGNGGQEAATGFRVEVSVVQQTVTKVQVVQVSKAFAKACGQTGMDVARQMAGLTDQDALPVPVDADAQAPAAAAHEKAPEKDAPVGLVVSLHKSQDGDSVSVVLAPIPEAVPPAADDAGKIRIDAAAAQAVPTPVAVSEMASRVAQPQVEKVGEADVLDKPKGETVYRMHADKNGVELLEAVKPVQAGHEGLAAHANAHHAAAPAAEGMEHAEAATPFADRLAQAQQARVSHQVAVQVQPLLDQGGGSVRMTLNPPELGRISIELQVADGKVHGAIAASDPAVVEQLARDLHSLRQGLAEAGLKLGDQGINLMLSNQNFNNQGQGQQQGHTPRGGRQGGGEVDAVAEAAPASAWVAPERVLDVRI